MKKILPIGIGLVLAVALFFGISYQTNAPVSKVERKEIKVTQTGKKKTLKERALFNEARVLHEYYMQVNPNTGEIPRSEKVLEFKNARNAETTANRSSRAVEATYINRGPSNFGGRTRSLAQDVTDVTGNTMLACGISGGVFRTTDGGASWVKVSSNDEIHNASAIVQDKRAGFENIWYYGTGEGIGNSAAASQAAEATLYMGNGIWKSTDGGLNWSQMPSTASTQESFDSRFDVIYSMAVHPITGDLYAANMGRVSRFDGASWTDELIGPGGYSSTLFTDVTITDSGRVYAAFSGNQAIAIEGIWTSATGIGGWSRINAASFTPAGIVAIALAPSNQDKLYTLFENGNTASCTGPVQEVDLWMWDQGTTTWTDYTSKLPNETPCNAGTVGNVPMTVQGGYDIEISVKPNDENFVVIGGTNVYKKANITTAGNFLRAGGYQSPSSYDIYNVGGTEHHPDIHELVFDFANPNILISGTDGGVHEADITAGSVAWSNLNNNYQTFQYYHVGIDPLIGSDFIIGGAQDNGTNIGGTVAGLGDLTTQERVSGGDGVAAEISRDDATIPLFLGFQFGNLYRIKNILTSPTDTYIEPSGSSSSFVTYFYLDPDNNNALYYAGQNTLYRTVDATNVTTTSWTNMGNTSTAFGDLDYFKTFSTTRGAYNAGTSYLLMGGDEGHIYRLDDPQNTMLSSGIDITPSTATIGFPSIVTGLAIHPTNNDIVLATYANYGTNSIYLTTNATSATPTWTLVERNLSAHSIRSAAITEVGGEVLYFVGTARGLYSTPDPTSVDWTREAPTQLGYALISSLRYRPSDNKLLIGTHGNGVYEATVSTALSLDDVNDVSNKITLYPNPTESEINFKSQNLNIDDTTSYTIIDILGKAVRSGTITNKKVDVSQLNSGLYFINIEANGLKQAIKFIKK
jgi:hypothetical protein